jgi:hypothetical protein
MLRDLESKREQRNKQRRQEPERRKEKKRGPESASSMTVRDRKREDAYHLTKRQDAAPNSTQEKQIHTQSQTRIRPGNPQKTGIRKYIRLLLSFLNRTLLKLTIKSPDQMQLHVKVEITHYDEMNDKTFDIDMNVWNNAGNVIEPISFHLFHGYNNWEEYT